MKKRVLLIVWCISFIWLSGCVNIPLTHYYTFHPDLETTTERKSPKYPYVIGIETYEASAPYQQDRIVYRTSSYEVNFYEYRRWLHLPTDLVTGQVQRLFTSSGLFERVHAYAFEAYADYIIRGKILMFDQWYSDDTTSSVRVGILYQLIAPEEERIIWMDSVETTAAVPGLELVETVKGFESALQENIRQALAAIDHVFAQRQ